MLIYYGVPYKTNENMINNYQAIFESDEEFIEEMNFEKDNKQTKSYVHGHDLVIKHVSAF